MFSQPTIEPMHRKASLNVNNGQYNQESRENESCEKRVYVSKQINTVLVKL